MAGAAELAVLGAAAELDELLAGDDEHADTSSVLAAAAASRAAPVYLRNMGLRSGLG